MSSKGCSRWGFGHTSSRGPVAPDDPLYPHDNQGYGDFWRARWDEAFQILTHYYAGIHIRNASGNIVTPEYRWNPLRISWAAGGALPPPMTPGNSYFTVIMVQNTSIFDWDWPTTRYAYHWETLAGTVVNSGYTFPVEVLIGAIHEGGFSIQSPVNSGVYVLTIDMQVSNGGIYEYFYNREPGRDWYPLTYICEVGNNGQCYLPDDYPGGNGGNDIYLPIIVKNTA